MALNAADRKLYRRDVAADGTVLGDDGRGNLIKNYLPEPHTLRKQPSSPKTTADFLTTSASSPTKETKGTTKMNNLPSVRPHQPSKNSTTSKPTTSHSAASPPTRSRWHKRRIRPLLTQLLHVLLYHVIQLLYGILLRISYTWAAIRHRLIALRHYHHRSPEYIARDVSKLSRVPDHLSVVLKYRPEERGGGGAEGLVEEVSELGAWCVAAGIGLLSVYEKQGVLKGRRERDVLERVVEQKLGEWFGEGSARPTFRIVAAGGGNGGGHTTSTGSHTATGEEGLRKRGTTTTSNGNSAIDSGKGQQQTPRIHIDILLLSESDGRDTLVDLTRTLTEMAQAKKIRPKDITSELINTEISATTAVPDLPASYSQQSTDLPTSSPTPKQQKEVAPGEPDLVIIFGPTVKLDGYPPWQIRLSEIFCTGGDPSKEAEAPTRVEYQAS
ncbi:Dehydrodolichyl diphosphate syntase complex subunit NUS1 [Cyphellophora attinorum]|uniref:ditrans,polycis-polyprenyl diphosphate synthase [(2E,6E)-farnesyldiphosphate specific] n=1 Tax=Cyphellophora attinorum TaxID=1664694 RepID=A0A0N1I0V2_9EURO|nr:Dehydrodolichyl diphosphate syntase complex subunit NUS1 [Phialophora attinorum]KPI45274.1 Dehydrodolichyl diphosphate syntase complex subunit NUS1 [Phialophora attinorum]